VSNGLVFYSVKRKNNVIFLTSAKKFLICLRNLIHLIFIFFIYFEIFIFYIKLRLNFSIIRINLHQKKIVLGKMISALISSQLSKWSVMAENMTTWLRFTSVILQNTFGRFFFISIFNFLTFLKHLALNFWYSIPQTRSLQRTFGMQCSSVLIF
jgi:hypothetical protein